MFLRQADSPSRGLLASVCVSELIRYNICLLHLQWIGRRGQIKKAGNKKKETNEEIGL